MKLVFEGDEEVDIRKVVMFEESGCLRLVWVFMGSFQQVV